MNEEIKKYDYCPMCQLVNTGKIKFGLKTYEQLKTNYVSSKNTEPFPELNEVLCQTGTCRSAYIMLSFGCDKKEALETLSMLEKKAMSEKE